MARTMAFTTRFQLGVMGDRAGVSTMACTTHFQLISNWALWGIERELAH
jgi:hypothetical protein